MRKTNLRDVFIGALATALIFMLIGAGRNQAEPEEIAAAFTQTGEVTAWLFTNKGTVIKVKGNKYAVSRGKWETIEIEETHTKTLKAILEQ